MLRVSVVRKLVFSLVIFVSYKILISNFCKFIIVIKKKNFMSLNISFCIFYIDNVFNDYLKLKMVDFLVLNFFFEYFILYM